jgi:putative transposase
VQLLGGIRLIGGQTTQVLTILDIYSRWQLGLQIANSIKSEGVINLFVQVFNTYPKPQKFVIRNDDVSHGGDFSH